MTELKQCELTLVTQEEKAMTTIAELNKVVKELQGMDPEKNMNLKLVNNIMMWNVNMNLNQLTNDEIIPFLEAFVERGGLEMLIGMLKLGIEPVQKEAIKYVPAILEFYEAHNYMKMNMHLCMEIWECIEVEKNSNVIKSMAFKSLTQML